MPASVDGEIAADDGIVGTEARRPQVVREHGDSGSARPSVVRDQRPSAQRGGAEQREDIRSDGGDFYRLRLGAANERRVPLPLERRHRREHSIVRAPDEVIGRRNREEIQPTLVLSGPESHERVRLAIWQWAKKDAIGDTEHRRRRPDPEPQRHHDHEREREVRGECSDGVAQVLLHGVHPSRSLLSCRASAAELVTFVAHAAPASKSLHRCLFRFAAGHTGTPELLDAHRYVKRELLVDVLARVSAEEATVAAEDRVACHVAITPAAGSRE